MAAGKPTGEQQQAPAAAGRAVRKLEVLILSDNRVASGNGVLAEHGFSAFVQADGEAFLFDVGQAGVVLGNAARLGADLSRAYTITLSHGHYDHTGALVALLDAYGPRQVIGHPDLFTTKYVRRRAQQPRSIGIGASRADLRRRGAVLSLAAGPQEVCPGVVTTGPIPRHTQFESIPSRFAVRSGGRFQRDQFEEEQGIVVRTRQGLVVLVGCSHRGMVNTLYRAIQLAGDTRVLAVIGGTHLGPASQEQIEHTIGALRELDVGTIVACHCTGFRAAARLAAALGDRFDPGGVGYSFRL